MDSPMRAARDLDEFYSLTDRISDEGTRFIRYNVSLPGDYTATAAEAASGDVDSAYVLDAWSQMRRRVAHLPRGERLPCVCCTRSLKPRRFAFVLVLPLSQGRAKQGMTFGLCERCAPDREAARAAAIRGIKAVWPGLREITVHPEAGHA